MGAVDRRVFLKGSVGAALLAGPMQGLVARSALAAGGGRSGIGFGPLAPSASLNTGEHLLDLPRGFQYRVIGKAGSPMSDGVPTPINHDGMASFRYERGVIRMIRNHEVLPSDDPAQAAFGTSVMTPYDPQGPGGTTTMELTPEGRLLRAWVSQNGTAMNCAGGAMPWGAWVTCEETILGTDARTNFLGQVNDLEGEHGYIFEVPVTRGPSSGASSPPIRSAGRFNHEAVAWGHDGWLYLTEDNFNGPSGFYRYQPPNDPMRDGHIADGGRLQVLVVDPGGQVPVLPTGAADLRGSVGAGSTFQTSWVDIPVPDPVPGSFVLGDHVPIEPTSLVLNDYELPASPSDVQMSRAVALQGYALGAGNFARIEGCWYGEGKVFFCATAGGAAASAGRDDSEVRRGNGNGQVWMYDVAGGQLTLIVEADNPADSDDAILDGPDNITLSPRGGLIVCEDGDGANFLRGVTVDGDVFDLARTADGIDSEFAGANFNPNGNVLFANLQDVTTEGSLTGLTVVISGPFGSGPV
jgi:secreted PhoX family phosphatase